MAWTVILEDENKTQISSGDVELISQLIFDPSNIKKFKLLKYLDPYGDTIFNHLQMDDLISDLKVIQEINHNNDIEKIINLANECKIGLHVYLVFYGD